MIESKSFLSRLFDISNYIFLTIFALCSLLPFLYVLINSFAGSSGFIIPDSFSLDAYRYILSTDTFLKSLGVSVYITVIGTIVSLALTSLMAYSLSHTNLPGRKYFLMMAVFTMLFSGGMIPTYFIVKNLGLINSLWALILPNAISAFYLIIMKNFYQNIPEELKESARIDGAHELTILLKIVLPLSMPVMAAFALFYSVGIWNQYFSAILYIQDHSKWPIQVLLRQIVVLSSGGMGEVDEYDSEIVRVGEAIKMAVIIISTVPIICVYPFLQKHFAKGVLLGSVKG